MAALRKLKCTVCKSGDDPLKEAKIKEYHEQIPDWSVIQKDGVKKIRRQFSFENFASALEFTNEVGELAEEEDHHPMIQTEWGRVTVTWWTHKIDGLHENDFIMAAKCDEAYEEGDYE